MRSIYELNSRALTLMNVIETLFGPFCIEMDLPYD